MDLLKNLDNMNKIPTAKEWFSDEFQLEIYSRKLTQEEKGIEFAKIHVKKALEQSSEESNGYTEHCPDFAILESYPLENIK